MNTDDIKPQITYKKKSPEILEIEEPVDKKEIEEIVFSKISPAKTKKPEDKTKPTKLQLKAEQIVKKMSTDKTKKNSFIEKSTSQELKAPATKEIIKSKIVQRDDLTSSESSESPDDISEKIKSQKPKKEINNKNNNNVKTVESKLISSQNIFPKKTQEIKIVDVNKKLDLKIPVTLTYTIFVNKFII